MSVIKKFFQSVLKEDGENREETLEIIEFKNETSKIINRLERGNNGKFGDEYEEDIEEDDEKNNINKAIFELEEEEEDNDDDSNYRDKDKEAKRKYIEKIKRRAQLIVSKMSKYKKSKKAGIRKILEDEGDWGKRTSERNLNREIGGSNRDYEGERRYELFMRALKVKKYIEREEAAKIVIRRRRKRMHLNNRAMRGFTFLRKRVATIKAVSNRVGIFISSRNIIKDRNLSVRRVRDAGIKLNKKKKEARVKQTTYLKALRVKREMERRGEEIKQEIEIRTNKMHKNFVDALKSQKKAQKNLNRVAGKNSIGMGV